MTALTIAGGASANAVGNSGAVKTEASPPKRGGICIAFAFTGTDSAFKCEHLGQVTIKQIYEKGFRVVVQHDIRNTAGVALIIEEQ